MLELRHISKSFPGVKALQDVSLEFKAGEVHAICGENGAGKTTLMNIIAGNIKPDSGELLWNGRLVSIGSAQEARKMGIGIVHQERSLVDSLSVAENIFPVNQPVTPLGLIDHKKLYRQAASLLEELGLKDISPARRLGLLSAAQRQMIEIAKALAQHPSLLILDEPTASITHHETGIIFELIHRLKEKGVAIIYISHRMQEITVIADTVSILKDGIYQGTLDPRTSTTREIVARMVGRELLIASYHSDATKEPVLELQHLSGRDFNNINFILHKGEILGLAGLQGSGRTSLAGTLFGDRRILAGTILKNGLKLSLEHPADAIKAGIAYLPDERKSLGLFMGFSIASNIVSSRLQKGFYRPAKIKATAESVRESLGIRAVSVRQEVQQLSGGNQQKVVLGKWLRADPDILIVNEPTHGVDVGAKTEIYNELKKLTAAGKSILLISSELPELLLLCDRIAVMYKGGLQDILGRKEATEERVTALASGIFTI